MFTLTASSSNAFEACEIKNISVLAAVGVVEEGYRLILSVADVHKEGQGRLDRLPRSSQVAGLTRRQVDLLRCLSEVGRIGR